jgi:tetratricopeptide (TPR) repeat protein
MPENWGVASLPGSYLMHYESGRAFFEKSGFDEAARAFEESARLNPAHAPSFGYLAAARAKLGRHEQAVEAYREAIRLNPNDRFALKRMGSSLANLGRWGEAVDQYRRAVLLDPRDAEAQFNLGVACLTVGDTRAARKQQELLRPLDASLAGKLRDLLPPE